MPRHEPVPFRDCGPDPHKKSHLVILPTEDGFGVFRRHMVKGEYVETLLETHAREQDAEASVRKMQQPEESEE